MGRLVYQAKRWCQTRTGRDPREEVSRVGERELRRRGASPEAAARPPPRRPAPALLRYRLRLGSASRPAVPQDPALPPWGVLPRAGVEEALPGPGEGRAPPAGGRASAAEAEGGAEQGRWRAARPVVRRCEAGGGAAGPGAVSRTPRPRAGRNKGSVRQLPQRRRSLGNRLLPLYPGASPGWGRGGAESPCGRSPARRLAVSRS